MSKNTNKKTNAGGIAASFASLLLLGVILVAINYISGILFVRADMTAEKLFTLSEGTKSVLDKIVDKPRLKFYFSRSMPNIPFLYKQYGKRVEEFLGEYVASSKGKLELEALDPQPDTNEEEWAVKYGLAAAGLPTGEKFYLGLVVNAADKEEVIPFFAIDREEFLEYDITRAIVQVMAAKKPTIGILSALPIIKPDNMPFMQGQPGAQDDWLFVKELRKNFQITRVDEAADTINADIDLLLVVHPKNLPETTVYAIDQFVLRGGRAIIAVDPACMADNQQAAANPYMGMMNMASDLPVLFKAWGVDYKANKLIGDMNLATRVNMGPSGLGDHPLWLSLKGTSFNKEAAVSGKLNSMLMVNAGSLGKAAGSAFEFTTLLQTSEAASEVDTFRLMSPPDEIRRDLGTTGSVKTLAALVRGEFASAFAAPPALPAPDGETDDAKKIRETKNEEKTKQHLTKAVTPVSVMVIADVDLLQNDYSVRAVNFFGSVLLQPLNDNLAFVANSVDLLAGSADLIAVRSRQRSNRSFTKVEEIERHAQKKWQEEEIALTRKLEEVQNRINQLQSQKQDGERLILSAEQRGEVEKARLEQSETMRRRREIRKFLRQDIEGLGVKITFANLLLIPILVIIFGAVIYFRQNTRRSLP